MSAYKQGYYAKNKGQIRNALWVGSIARSARKRARDANVPFDYGAVTEVLRNAPDCCPVLGHPFSVGGRLTFDSPTLDRIRPHLGYVRGNVQIICQRANVVKNDASANEVERIAAYMRGLEGGALTVTRRQRILNAIVPRVRINPASLAGQA